MYSKDYKNIKKEFGIFIEEARESSILATLFCALAEYANVYLSKKFYLALRDEVFKTTERYSYEEGNTRIITIRDERIYTNLQIELIEKKLLEEEVYFIREIKSKYLQYNSNMNDKGIGKILRLESEKGGNIYATI